MKWLSKDAIYPIFIIAATAIAQDPISMAIENYKGVESYSVTLRSGNGEDFSEIVRYYYKRPGFVRMELIKPFKGAILIYSPFTGEVTVRPFSFLKPFVLTLSPDNRLVKSSKGHRIDASDIGELLKTVKRLQESGKTKILKEEVVNEKLTMLVSVEGGNGFTVDGVHRYLLWLDKTTFLPLKVSSFDISGGLIEEVLMDDLRINIGVEDRFFSFP
ncbi:MAG: LolA family protein [Thermodesulfovibrionales bacterium]